MGRFYGKPTKFVRHSTLENLTIEPQRLQQILCWKYDSAVSAYTDGQDVETKTCRLGSRIVNHRVDMTIQPETIEPQKVYMGTLKLSFHDYASPYISGNEFEQGSYQDATPTQVNRTAYTRLWLDDTKDQTVTGTFNTDIDISDDINAVLLDDNFKHWIQLKKPLTIFDQRPLVSNRKMRVPSKVKRINPGTLYMLWIWNDSVRGATPADTQIKVRLKQYFEEWAI